LVWLREGFGFGSLVVLVFGVGRVGAELRVVLRNGVLDPKAMAPNQPSTIGQNDPTPIKLSRTQANPLSAPGNAQIHTKNYTRESSIREISIKKTTLSLDSTHSRLTSILTT
jgi:hypothetical protein